MALKRQRRARTTSITSLIDVIFLLLLFFMLASTFTQRAEIELVSGAETSTPSPRPETQDIIRIRVRDTDVEVEGQAVQVEELAVALAANYDLEGQTLAVEPMDTVTTQRLVDTLMALRALPGVRVHVVEPS